MRSRSLVIAPVVLAFALTLSACAAPATDDASVSTPLPSATEKVPTPGPGTAVATSSPDEANSAVDGVPLGVTCEQVATAQQVYDYNANFSLDSSYRPATGSVAAEIVRQNGVACAWVNQTSGERIEIAVAKLPADHSTRLKNALVRDSNSVPTYGVEGYFEASDGLGIAQAFPDPYWVVASSAVFLEPGDVTPLMSAVIGNLG